jgi:hypothetical protein
LSSYKLSKSDKCIAKNILLSNGVTDMIIVESVMYISDQLRGEVAIIENFRCASQIKGCRLRVLNVDSCISLSFVFPYLIVLRKANGEYLIELLSIATPLQNRKEEKSLYAKYNTLASLKSETAFKNLFFLPGNYFGAHTISNNLHTYEITGDEITQINTLVTSSVKMEML